MSLFPLVEGKNHTELKKELQQERQLILSGIGNPTAKSFLICDFFKSLQEKILWLCQDNEELFEIYKDISLWFPYPIFLLRDEDDETRIIHKLLQFRNSQLSIFLFSSEQAKLKIPTQDFLEQYSYQLVQGAEQDAQTLIHTLIEEGYEFSEETILPLGTYRRIGDTLEIFPVGEDNIIRIDFNFDTIESISTFDPLTQNIIQIQDKITIYPAKFTKEKRLLAEVLSNNKFVIFDELEEMPPALLEAKSLKIYFTSFPQEDDLYHHLRYISVLKFYTLPDLLTDLRNKIQEKWKIVIYTKRKKEIENIFKEEELRFSTDLSENFHLTILEAADDEYIPVSFQNPNEKIAFITDKEIFSIKKSSRNQSISKMNIDFITSLTPGDYIVHFDHGIGLFNGIIERTIDNVTREYLEIEFAQNDKLFIPVDQADKISKYIHEDGSIVTLSKLGGTEWQKQVKKAKKETAALAKELLELYAKRAQAKRKELSGNREKERAFAETFPYEETPGQLSAILDVKRDMEGQKPMDRLICGDVGFGKTEVAMRAAFKAVQSGMQVAVISPVTILAEQHFLSFKKRMDQFGIRIEMLSRFRSEAEQKKVVEKLRKGDCDIVIGTHRLIQSDIEFLNLGLLIIDEEQRFGVKQKEKLKNLRTQVDVLTLTATPIPRTLNLSLNKLRDITTITTPPPGRLPIITEVRKYSDQLVRDAILKELKREGQIYFLHNRVETIESIAEKLRTLVPEASFVVAHGQLSSHELEERILAFKRGEYDVLISSTIIENGIDLASANTMIINNAEKFGLSQLYQLRGRIGRSNKQAYAYLLYHAQKLSLDAKKRLRALVEASELGAGFQIAMRDLEIRGAGEILGSSQHGSMNSIGVGHFLKTLHKTVKEMQNGTYVGDTETQASDISIEIPIEAFIPNDYIVDRQEKILVYQKLAAVEEIEMLKEFYQDIYDEYGKPPKEMENLFKILRMKIYARKARVLKVLQRNTSQNTKEIQLLLSDACTPEFIVKALEKNKYWQIIGNTLKIEMSDLGENWFDALIETIETMAI